MLVKGVAAVGQPQHDHRPGFILDAGSGAGDGDILDRDHHAVGNGQYVGARSIGGDVATGRAGVKAARGHPVDRVTPR